MTSVAIYSSHLGCLACSPQQRSYCSIHFVSAQILAHSLRPRIDLCLFILLEKQASLKDCERMSLCRRSATARCNLVNTALVNRTTFRQWELVMKPCSCCLMVASSWKLQATQPLGARCTCSTTGTTIAIFRSMLGQERRSL